MAEGKKSFIIYCDLIHVVSKLPNEKAGELFKHILEYVNDNNPETDDLLLQVLFEPIKLQLKRDLQKWENESLKRSDSGRLGGLKSGEARRKQKEANEASASKSKQSQANEAVTVTVNDTVNDIIYYLNSKSNKNFKSTSEKTKTMINARLKEGYKIEDFKKVVDIKSDKWKNDPKMCDYLRPETLFGTKFESYLNEIPKAEIKSNDEEKFFRSFENGKIIDTRNFKPGTLFTKSGEPILV
jgi:uncharacterized phage protein (TIGR02220 family)